MKNIKAQESLPLFLPERLAQKQRLYEIQLSLDGLFRGAHQA
jgi:hypothetical protein